MSFPVLETLSVLRGSPRYNAWLYSHIAPHLSGRVLDIGSGLGDISSQFNHPLVEEVIFSDHDDKMIRALEARPVPLKRYRVMPLDISNPQIHHCTLSGSIDTITCINVLEHIEDDVAALENMNHLLRVRGKVVVFVPAFPALYGTLDTYVEHYRRYTKKSLRIALERAGFAVKEAYYINMFGILTWFLAGRILKQKRFHRHACRMLDRTVPLLRTMESFGPPPLGQSLIMVGEKVS